MKIEPEKLSKLTVGDIAEYEEWRRDQQKKELIATVKELYGDKIPDTAFAMVEKELNKIPSLMDDDAFDLKAAQYLFWKSLSKKDPDITMKQVGGMLDMNEDSLATMSELLFPPGIQKKTVRPKRKQPKKHNR